jgi:hypothetical protein
MHLEVAGDDANASTAIPSTGDWQSWTTITLGAVSLTAGEHTLTIHIDSGEFNLNWLDFQLQ